MDLQQCQQKHRPANSPTGESLGARPRICCRAGSVESRDHNYNRSETRSGHLLMFLKRHRRFICHVRHRLHLLQAKDLARLKRFVRCAALRDWPESSSCVVQTTRRDYCPQVSAVARGHKGSVMSGGLWAQRVGGGEERKERRITRKTRRSMVFGPSGSCGYGSQSTSEVAGDGDDGETQNNRDTYFVEQQRSPLASFD